MKKELKRKPLIEQSSIRKGSPVEGVRIYGGKDLRKRLPFSLEWKRVGVMHSDSVERDRRAERMD